MIHFRFFNIPVTIHPSFLLFFILFTRIYEGITVYSLMLGAILIISLLVHEAGHALTAIYFGSSSRINLEGFGGNAEYDPYKTTPWQRFIITVNGPLLQSVLILIPYVYIRMGYTQYGYLNYFMYLMMEINIIWVLLNLIPVSPLDGGKILQYLLTKLLGEHRGMKFSLIIGIAAAALVGSYLVVEGYYLFGTMLLILGFQSSQQYKQSGFGFGFEVSNPLGEYHKGLRYLEDSEIGKAKSIFNKLLKSKNDRVRAWSAESLATVLHKENKNKEAYKNLLKVDHQYLTSGKRLLCKLAFEEGNYSLIEKYSRDIYEIEPTFETALLNSKAFASLNNPGYAGGWLKTASMFSHISQEDLKNALQHGIYDQVRDHEVFKKSMI